MHTRISLFAFVITFYTQVLAGCSGSDAKNVSHNGGGMAGMDASGIGEIGKSGGASAPIGTGGSNNSNGGVTTQGGKPVSDSGSDTMGSGGINGSGGVITSGGTMTPDGAATKGGNTSLDGAVEMGGTTGSGDAGTVGTIKKFVGNITTRGQVRSDFAKYWDQITPENEGKWDAVEPSRDKMNWGALDKIYDYAKQNQILFKEHTFVWGSQQPGWIGGLSKTEQAEEVEEWIRLFCERYPDVAMIDVVNEPPPHTKPAVYEALGGAGATGYDWVATAFRWARKYCPKSVLILNDYNVLAFVTSDIINIANALKSQGLIDGLGSQSHGQEGQSIADLKKNLDKLIAVGLPVYITEFDLSTADDQKQLELYKAQFPLFWETPEVKGITLWGYVYGSTWGPAKDSGLLKGTTERPAMTWLMNYIGR